MRNCPLTDKQVSIEGTCTNCMYHTRRECLQPLQLEPIEFARKKKVSIQEMNAAASRIKSGILLNEYKEYVESYLPNDAVQLGRKAIDVCRKNEVISILGIKPPVLQEMCDPAAWKKFCSHFSIESSLTDALPFKEAVRAKIFSERTVMKVRSYTISKLEEQPDSGPVFVVNRTAGSKRGDVFLTVAKLNGLGTDGVTIPATWIPVDLTTVVNRRQLLADNNFRQSITSGLLQLVDPDDAIALLENDPDARSEKARISKYLIKGGMTAGEEGVDFGDEVIIDKGNEVFPDEVKDEYDDNDAVEVVPVYITSYINDVLHKAQQNDGKFPKDEVSDFKNRLRNFGQVNIKHLKTIYTSIKGSSPELAKFIKDFRDELKESQ